MKQGFIRSLGIAFATIPAMYVVKIVLEKIMKTE